MRTQQNNVNPVSIHAAPRFSNHENVARVISMSSTEIAELTGKQHKNVIRDIRDMLDELQGDGSDLSHAMRGSLAGGAERIVHPWSADGDHSKRVVIRRSTSFVANAFVDHCKAPKTCPVEMTGQVRQMKVISFGWVGISPTLDQQAATSPIHHHLATRFDCSQGRYRSMQSVASCRV